MNGFTSHFSMKLFLTMIFSAFDSACDFHQGDMSTLVRSVLELWRSLFKIKSKISLDQKKKTRKKN